MFHLKGKKQKRRPDSPAFEAKLASDHIENFKQKREDRKKQKREDRKAIPVTPERTPFLQC